MWSPEARTVNELPFQYTRRFSIYQHTPQNPSGHLTNLKCLRHQCPPLRMDAPYPTGTYSESLKLSLPVNSAISVALMPFAFFGTFARKCWEVAIGGSRNPLSFASCASCQRSPYPWDSCTGVLSGALPVMTVSG